MRYHRDLEKVAITIKKIKIKEGFLLVSLEG